MPNPVQLYARLLRIRRFEEELLSLFTKGALFGTTHTSIGQEAIAVATFDAIDSDRDVVFSSHRCHGHFLEYGGDIVALFAEIMGRSGGVCGGMGGSQHLHYRNFYSNGIQGGIVPLAVGAALAERYRSNSTIAVVFLGDGTLGEGVVYESLNMASLWSAPVLFVLEDNRYAQSTARELGVAGSMVARARAFGIEGGETESNDVEELLPLMASRVAGVRKTGQPFFQVVHTYRLAPHSKGDDYRNAAEIESWRGRDPLVLVSKRLEEVDRNRVEEEVRYEVSSAVEAATASPWPGPDSLPDASWKPGQKIPGKIRCKTIAPPDPRMGWVTVGADLNAALHALMNEDDRVVLIGEDLLDPYGGAFKVSHGLSTRFPARVLSTPISEAGLVGVANGMALRGMRPVAEIMFGDFLALSGDQLLNHAAKFEGMYNGAVQCPVTVRTPMGGRRGYGPTHSQSIESMFFGVPGLEIVAVSPFHPAGELLRNAVSASTRPTIFIENKLMYARPVRLPDAEGIVGDAAARIGDGLYPTIHLSLDALNSCDLVLISTGSMAEIALATAERLLVDREIVTDVLIPSQLAPVPVEDLVEPVARAGRALVLEEGPLSWGWGAEIVAELHECLRADRPDVVLSRVGSRASTIPVSRPLEEVVLPQGDDVFAAALRILGEGQDGQ